ncbi:MAG TPA: hypothetical protein VI386_26640 [Candidatus Sulfotelmatobacter sp.]
MYPFTVDHAETEVILRAADQTRWWNKQMIQVFVKEQEEETFVLRYSGRSLSLRE